ncbi:hypothetical protein BDN67DRAFT_1071523 [Paxillus ammoniavirescens]|nr:hypothetical protein BDN67DRAFT_1071523 [Paxillus ammoniavirescens]
MSTPFTLVWGPTFIGFAIAIAAYGVTIGQFIHYVRTFSSDKVLVKVLVFIVFILDSAHTFLSTTTLYNLFIQCRRNASPSCMIYLPGTLTGSVCIIFWIAFIVQIFYAHRVWIISGYNRVVTLGVIVSAIGQLVLGLVVVDEIIRTPTFNVLSGSRYTSLSALSSAICDAIITSSVYYYLRPARTGIVRRAYPTLLHRMILMFCYRKGNIIKRLNFVFIQMGLLSLINTLALVILYSIQDHLLGQYLTAAPGIILGKTYVNSMLAVLNARKSPRDRPTQIEVPTIPTIY